MTRIAVISDIHGNAVALDAALADIERAGVDQIVCLGDAIQGGAQPAQTVARLRDLACPVVMGNADAWLLSGVETGSETITEEQEAVRQWSLAQLSEADRAYIAAFTPTVIVPLTPERDLLCFHGSPTSFDDILLPNSPRRSTSGCWGHTPLRSCAAATPTGSRSTASARRSSSTPAASASPTTTTSPKTPSASTPGLSTLSSARPMERWGWSSAAFPLPVDAVREALRASGRPNAEAFLAQYE